MKLNKNNLLNENGFIQVFLGDNKNNVSQIYNILLDYKTFINNNKSVISIDFEFNSGKIALTQMYLQHYPTKKLDYVLVFDPRNNTLTDIFKHTLLHNNTQVILHGGESLDIPYLFNELLIKPKNIIQFLKNMFDTKYLCEYEKIDKCKIYHLLKHKKVISKKIFDDIILNEEKMGKIYLINVDVNNLTNELLLYSVYDAIFLPKLLSTFSNVKIVSLFVQLNFLWKYNLLPQINKQKTNIDKVYNSFLKSNPKTRMNDLFNIITKKNDTILFKNLKNINFIKKFIETLQKIYLFPIIHNKFTFLYSYDKPVLSNDITQIDLPHVLHSIFISFINNINL